MCVVAVSHDLNLAAEFCDRLVVLSGGKVRPTPAREVTARPLRRCTSRVLVDRNPESARRG
jgi:ABC-type hemin transport system ATPase subunit